MHPELGKEDHLFQKKYRVVWLLPCTRSRSTCFATVDQQICLFVQVSGSAIIWSFCLCASFTLWCVCFGNVGPFAMKVLSLERTRLQWNPVFE